MERWRTISGTLIGIMGIQEVGGPDPDPARPFFGRRFRGRGIGGQLPARLVAWRAPGGPIPASTEASADRAGGYLVVLADELRILGLQGLRRREGIKRD